MDRTDRDFEEYSAQGFEDGGMSRDRRSTLGGPGRGGAGPHDMEDDMDDDMPPRGGYADMPSHTGRHRGSMGREIDHAMQLALLDQANTAALRRHIGGLMHRLSSPPTHSMESGSRHSHAGSGPSRNQTRFMPPSAMLSGSRHGRAGGSGLPRGPNGEPLVEYMDAEEHQNAGSQRYRGGDGHSRMGGSSDGGDLDADGESDDEPDYPPSMFCSRHRAAAAAERATRRHR